MATVKVDKRELLARREKVEAKLGKMKHTVIQETLQVGDYVINDTHAIEFKTIEDFMGSFTGGGAYGWRQLTELAENYEHAIIVVVGNFNEYADKLKNSKHSFKYMKMNQWIGVRAKIMNQYYSAIDAIAQKRKVGLVMLPTDTTFTDYLLNLARRADDGDSKPMDRPILTKKSGDRSIRDQASDMLCAVTGIGRKTADSILDNVASVSRVGTMSAEELAEIEGVRKSAAANLIKVLTNEEFHE